MRFSRIIGDLIPFLDPEPALLLLGEIVTPSLKLTFNLFDRSRCLETERSPGVTFRWTSMDLLAGDSKPGISGIINDGFRKIDLNEACDSFTLP